MKVRYCTEGKGNRFGSFVVTAETKQDMFGLWCFLHAAERGMRLAVTDWEYTADHCDIDHINIGWLQGGQQ